MQLTHWNPFGDFDRFFDELPAPQKPAHDLAVDIYEKDGSFVAEMSLPGTDPGKLDVSVEENYLRIRGGTEEQKEEKNKHYYRKEIRRGTFERVVRLPASVLKDKVNASYKDGVLTVTLPKAEGDNTGARKVKVER